MACGYSSADRYLESLDSDEWTEYLALWELENLPDVEPTPVQDVDALTKRLDLSMGLKPSGSNDRKTKHGQHARQH